MEHTQNLVQLLNESTERVARAPPIFTPLRLEMEEVTRYVSTFKSILEEAFGNLIDEIKRAKCHEQVYEAVRYDLTRNERKMVIEVEDIIDFCVDLVAEHDKEAVGRQSICRRPVRNRSSMNKKIDSLVEKVRYVMEDKLKPLLQETRRITIDSGYPIRPYDASPDTIQHYPTTADRIKEPPKHEYVVGFEEVANTIIVKNLLERSSGLRHSLNGMWGVGKTTLASKIYHDPRIQNEFPIIVWASKFEDMIAAIWDKLFQQEVPPLQPLEELHQKEKELATIVQDNLRTKNFLIFLEDFDSSDGRFQQALPMDNKIGKVLMIASELHGDYMVPMIRLECMDECTGWELLHLQVYGKMDEDSHPELERVGKFIVKQCGGLPRAIVLMGNILSEKLVSPTRKMRSVKIELRIWKEVASRVKDYLFDPHNPESMQNYMSMRFDKLFDQPKENLLYLSMIPQGNEISESELFDLRNVARYNVDSFSFWRLVAKSLARDKKRNVGVRYSCSLHILMHEFCKIKLAAAYREKEVDKYDFHEIKITSEHDPVEEYDMQGGELCINSHVLEFLSKKPNLQNIRSFLCFSKETITLENKDIDALLVDKLRVFKANTIKFPEFPTKLTRSVHLRYVSLSGDKINVLPQTISKWRHIQHLTLNTLSPTLEIKANIWEMTRLERLITEAAIILNNDESGEGCKNLRVLQHLSPQSCTEQVAQKAKNLKTLGIRGELGKLQDSNFLEKLGYLEELTLVHEVSGNHPGLTRLPPTNKFPPQLRHLKLSGTFLNWDKMTVIAGLGKLRQLILNDNAFVGDRWDVEGGAFPELVYLTIKNTNLRHWTAQDDSFPWMMSLELENCDKLEGIPMELGNNTLFKLDLTCASPATISSAKEMKENIKQMHEWFPFTLNIDSEVEPPTYGHQLFSAGGHTSLYEYTDTSRKYKVPKMDLGY